MVKAITKPCICSPPDDFEEINSIKSSQMQVEDEKDVEKKSEKIYRNLHFL